MIVMIQNTHCQEYFCLCAVSNLKGFNAFVLDSLLPCPLVQLQVVYWLGLSENEREKRDFYSPSSTTISHAFTSDLTCFPLSMIQVQIRHFYLLAGNSFFFSALGFWKIKCYLQKKRGERGLCWLTCSDPSLKACLKYEGTGSDLV